MNAARSSAVVSRPEFPALSRTCGLWPTACLGHGVRCSTAAAAASAASGGSGPTLSRNTGYHYQRRDVERSALYSLVRDHLETFYQAVEEGFASAPLPDFVKREFERFLDCGVLCRGAALLVCETCSQTNVIALSCKGRGYAE